MIVGKEREKGNALAVLIRRALIAWLAAVTLEYLLTPAAARELTEYEALIAMSPLRVALVTGAVLVLLYLPVFRRLGRAGRWALPLLFSVYSAAALAANPGWALLAGCAAILALTVVWALRGWDGSEEAPPAADKPRPIWAWLTAVMALGFFLFVSVWTVARVRNLSTASYDFGIFSQMFASMRRTGLPMTTLERSELLSHFRVHISPIFYLMLPFYCLVPRPETLQVLQAAVMASAVIPLWKLGGLHGLTGPRRFLLCAILLLAPAFAGGAAFDLHENCFLTVLLLWLLWSLDRNNRPVTLLAALLTLCVKEDASIYVGIIGLWASLRAGLRPAYRRQLSMGLALLCGALLWFFGASWLLSSSGKGVMLGRYNNLLYERPYSALTLVKAVLGCPMKILRECVNAEKLPYLALTLGPLLGIPIWTRRWERLLLLLPWILFNLLAGYAFQHSLYYQYSFGSIACLLYLTCVNLAPRTGKPASGPAASARLRLAALILAALVSAGCFAKEIGPTALKYVRRAVSNAERTEQIREILEQIPEEASVAASTFYTVPLADREILFDLGYFAKGQPPETDYVVISATDELKRYASEEGGDGPERLRALLTAQGYERTAELPGVLEVWRR